MPRVEAPMPKSQSTGDIEGTAAIHPSKRDWWLVLIIWALVGVSILSGVKVAQEATTSMLALGYIILCGVIILFVLTILYATYYIIIDDRLTAHSGPFKHAVLLQDIEEVVPSRNPLSSPALSLDRLHVRYRGSMFGLLISPRNKQAFLADLVARAPHLQIDGDRAVSGGHR